MKDDVPLVDRDAVGTLLVTIDVMALVKMFGPTLWSCRLCEHSDAAPGAASMLRAIGEHMKREHEVGRPVPAKVCAHCGRVSSTQCVACRQPICRRGGCVDEHHCVGSEELRKAQEAAYRAIGRGGGESPA